MEKAEGVDNYVESIENIENMENIESSAEKGCKTPPGSPCSYNEELVQIFDRLVLEEKLEAELLKRPSAPFRPVAVAKFTVVGRGNNGNMACFKPLEPAQNEADKVEILAPKPEIAQAYIEKSSLL